MVENIPAHNNNTFVASLKACAKKKDLCEGIRLHAHILERLSLEKNPYIASTLIHMYTQCGELDRARQVLESLPFRDVVSWSALISGYSRQGLGLEALKYFEQMLSEGLSPDAITFTCILRACGSMKTIEKGLKIHEEIVSRDLLKKDAMLGASLVDMYVKCGVLTRAHEVLKELQTRNVVSWNALISGYVHHGQFCEALNYFEEMQLQGISPNAITFTCILKACGSTGAIDKGKRIHEEIVGQRLLEKDIVLGNALVDMYTKCGVLTKAQSVLEELPKRDIVSWSTVIAGYAQHGQLHEALDCFRKMRSEGLYPNAITFVCLLKACGSAGALNKGEQIHDEIVSRCLLEKDIVLGNALVDMYAKCGVLSKAEKVLEALPVRNVISWSTLIMGHAQHGQCHEALNCIERMEREGLCPNSITFICILKACGNSGAIDEGKRIHEKIVSKELLDKDIMLGTALVDMYAKCGMLSTAQTLLEELPVRDVVSWSTLIAGYAQQGKGCEALKCFNSMQMEGFSPDEIMFLCMLNACGHSGLMYEAEMLFANMLQKYNVAPNFEHYACMVLIFGCGGNFEKAMSVITAMPSRNPCAVWLSLLSTSRKWGNVKLARLAFNQVVRLDKSCTAAYALMANTLADNDMQENAENIESTRLA